VSRASSPGRTARGDKGGLEEHNVTGRLLKATWARAGGGRKLSLLALPLLALVVAGCGPATGKVSGMVKVGDKPLPAGWVTFHSQAGTGEAVEVPIKDGHYTIPRMVVGPVKITLRTYDAAAVPAAEVPKGVPPMPSDQIKGKHAGPPPAFVPVPKKYADLKATDLEYTVTRGEQEHNIVLKPLENPS
jgi:hypothetical protein